ncbi:hypothetical protein GRAN_1456 [Granulicella sibirica]|uniref:Uncharacterized protein n=1 Tax=Granulicella sibirica TaxID=2479048 RepID=A0A4Q0T8U4_9BACT|nr:hypothetical protein GRAN_1456 [Granulicella sibirica]
MLLASCHRRILSIPVLSFLTGTENTGHSTPPSTVNGIVVSQFPKLTLSEKVQSFSNKNPDAVLAQSYLTNGALYSAQIEGGKNNGSGLRIDSQALMETCGLQTRNSTGMFSITGSSAHRVLERRSRLCPSRTIQAASCVGSRRKRPGSLLFVCGPCRDHGKRIRSCARVLQGGTNSPFHRRYSSFVRFGADRVRQMKIISPSLSINASKSSQRWSGAVNRRNSSRLEERTAMISLLLHVFIAALFLVAPVEFSAETTVTIHTGEDKPRLRHFKTRPLVGRRPKR